MMVESTSSSTSSTGSNILTTLNAGSGIDTATLVSTLVTAQFDAQNQTLTHQQDTLTSQLTDVSNLKSAISGFSTALSQLVTGGTLSTAATSSNSTIVKATTLSGASIANLSANVEVRQLAAAQTAYSDGVTDQSAAVGQGTLTLTFGKATVSNGAMTGFTAGSASSIDITIDSSNSSLTGIRDAINAAKAGVTASIVKDNDQYRLVLKGQSGEAQAFTLSATEDSGAPGLSALNVGVGATGTQIGNVAADAIVAVDGVPVHRSTNAVSDLIPGVRLDLLSASVGTNVAIGSTPQIDALRQAVNDVVTTYNQVYATVKAAVDPVNGSLRSDTAAKNLLESLRQLSLTPLSTATDGSPKTLAELGVATGRDGTLSLNSSQLNTALTNYPDAIANIFSAGQGLSSALYDISSAATSTKTGLGLSETTYKAKQSDLSVQQDKLSSQEDDARTRLTLQFTTMNSRVAAYKSTQSFLTQQIAAWNSSGN